MLLLIPAILAVCCYIVYALLLSHVPAYRNLPRPTQPPFYLRILHEPSSFEITQWVRTVPNDGLIRYFGLLNQERLLITCIGAYKQLLLRDASSYDKLPALAAVQWPVGVSGLVSAKGALHKVSGIHRDQSKRAQGVQMD